MVESKVQRVKCHDHDSMAQTAVSQSSGPLEEGWPLGCGSIAEALNHKPTVYLLPSHTFLLISMESVPLK
jgi:hypothetical protein